MTKTLEGIIKFESRCLFRRYCLDSQSNVNSNVMIENVFAFYLTLTHGLLSNLLCEWNYRCIFIWSIFVHSIGTINELLLPFCGFGILIEYISLYNKTTWAYIMIHIKYKFFIIFLITSWHVTRYHYCITFVWLHFTFLVLKIMLNVKYSSYLRIFDDVLYGNCHVAITLVH